MDDLISRRAAIEALYGIECHEWDDVPGKYFEWDDVEQCLNGLPSAKPERGEGRWIIQDHPATGWFRVLCSECGEDVTSNAPIIGFFPNAKCIWDFCPWCGAKMGGGEK